ncbi:MAG: single-stranded-DNA-specific exonuclease RecJ [Christensenellales bacterium]
MLNLTLRTGRSGVDAKRAAVLEAAAGICAPAAALLAARGMDTPDKAKRFLYPGPEQFNDPMLLPDIAQSIERIRFAVNAREKIMVYCDYDADGITGGCALYLFLKRLGADVRILTPNRHKEGYGLNERAVTQMAQSGVSLVITVDCGITNNEEIKLAGGLGIDTIITDHHECPDTLPSTPYIINAKREDSLYPDKNLAGCGVVFKLISALSSLAEAMRYIDLIAVGTITDIVPLIGENRVIAHMGLQRLNKNPSAGIAALAKQAGIEIGGINSYYVSFGLGPRINAAGRMDTAQLAIDLRKAEEPDASLAEKAEKLCALNNQRKKEVEEILLEAQQAIEKNRYYGEPVIMLASPDWNAGVLGIAAAKIAEKYVRPCVLFGGRPLLAGSARSIDGINIYTALAAFGDRYEKFGGHEQAAGLTIKPDTLDSLRRDVCEYIRDRYDESVFVKTHVCDLVLSPKDITRKLAEDLQRLEPFGAGNEKPVIALKDALLAEPRFVGKNDALHLKFSIKQRNDSCDAISFYYKETHALLPERADFLCEADIDSFSGKPRLITRDIGFIYSGQLAESFKSVYYTSLNEGLLNEASQFAAGAPRELTAEQINLCVSEALSQSRFGLCISVRTEPALCFLLKLPAVEKALSEGGLILWDEKSFSPKNCIACGEAFGHARVLRLGADESSLWCKELREAYKSHAGKYYAPREELLDAYAKLGRTLDNRPVTVSRAAKRLGIGEEKAVFALRVFAELELLVTDNNGRILTLNNKAPRKNIMQSACYRGFEVLING